MQSLKRAIRRGVATISRGAHGTYVNRKKGSTAGEWNHGVKNAVVDARSVDLLDRYNGHAY